MLYQEEPKQAAEYLRQVIPMLSQHNLAPTPVNYSVFYTYLSGASQSLNKAVDSIISEKKPFNLVTMLALYEKFINGGASLEQQEKIQQTLEKIISDTCNEIQQVNDEAGGFDNTLNKHSESLSATNDPQVATLILKQIMDETRSMIKSNQATQSKMDETNAEIMKMKAELEEVRATAEKDALTGLKNRGAFDKAISDSVQNQSALKTALVMLDIDHFKRINDNFGHLVGDRVIRYVSALLTQIIGENHHIARYGGEEFAVILTGMSIDDAKPLIEKIRIAMANSKLQRKDSGETIGQVTISAGITALKANDQVDSLIDRADKALYEAKETGRNKIVALG
ncbi:MAG: diguanylate cyclase [Cycloclasticus sp.]|nr:diguanylate cyclase [Cycloclasticus sp.]MBG97282.1 diguanylate cyclase [Cycloclasticus sp.]HAI96141.1 diguanylate cyclase [Methylococcaceae bacterium]